MHPIVKAEAQSWANRRSGPPESQLEPEMAVLRSLLPLVERVPRRFRGYAKAVVLRTLGRSHIRMRTAKATFVCDRRDHALIRTVCEEPFETALMARLITPGTTFVDVGANRGWFTLLGASVVESSGAVLAFEPDQRARRILVTSLADNPELSQRVQVFDCALSSEEGEDLWTGSQESALSHLLRSGDDRSRAVKVKTRALADVLRERSDLPTVSAIKIDVEGAEERVLKGLFQEGQGRRVPALLVEAEAEHLSKFGSSRKALIEMLAQSHDVFSVCWAHGDLERADGTECAAGGRNLLALRTDLASDLLGLLMTD